MFLSSVSLNHWLVNKKLVSDNFYDPLMFVGQNVCQGKA